MCILFIRRDEDNHTKGSWLAPGTASVWGVISGCHTKSYTAEKSLDSILVLLMLILLNENVSSPVCGVIKDMHKYEYNGFLCYISTKLVKYDRTYLDKIRYL